MNNGEKTMLGCVSWLLLIASFALAYVARFILYQHVKAPMELWVLFWIDVPLAILLRIVGKLGEKTSK